MTEQDQPFEKRETSASTVLRDKWRIATGAGPDQLLIEDLRTHKGVCIWVRINRKTGDVNPHDGSMFRSGQDAGSRAWETVPTYVKKFVAEHGRNMLEHAYPTPTLKDWKPSYNTINGQPMDGRGISL